MIRFLTDEDFKDGIYRGVRRRIPDIDILRIQDAGLRTFRDEIILEFAASTERLVLSHDLSTMGEHELTRIQKGLSMPGLLLISQNYPIGKAINEIVIVAECSQPEEWVNLIDYLPL